MKIIILLFIFGSPPYVQAVGIKSFATVDACVKFVAANPVYEAVLKGLMRCVSVK